MVSGKKLEEFGSLIGTYQDIWQKNDGRFVDPQKLIALTDNKASKKSKDLCNALAEYAFQRDNYSGVYTAVVGNFVTGVAKAYANYSKHNDVGIIEIDFENNKKAAKLLGLNRMKKLMRTTIGILKDEVEHEGADFSFPARTNINGDEFRVIFAGLDEEKINNVLNRFRNRTESLFSEIGLSNLVHPKHPNIAERNGVSVGAGYAFFNNCSDMQAKLDCGVELDKINRGIERKKHNGKEPADITPAQIPLLKKRFDNIIDSGTYKKFHDFEVVNKAFPVNILDNGQFSPYCDQINRELEKHPVPEPLKDLCSHRDKLTGFYRLSELVPDLQHLIKHIKNTGRNAHIVDFELRNLPGMNDHLGSENTDIVIKRVADIVKNTFNDNFKNGSVFAYTTFGGRFKILALDTSEDRLKNAMEQVVKKVESNINCANVKKFFNGALNNGYKNHISDDIQFSDIKNTYFKGDSGVTCHYSIAAIKPSMSAEENLQKLENKLCPQIRQGLWDHAIQIRR